MRVSPLLVAALLGGCAADADDHSLQVVYDVCDSIALVPGPGAEPAEIAGLDTAIDMWNRLGQSRLTREMEGSARVLEVRFETAAPVFYGVYDDEQGLVYINRRLVDPHERAVTIAHEVGHAYGLFHIAERISVMNPHNLAVEPTGDDAAELMALWGDCGAP